MSGSTGVSLGDALSASTVRKLREAFALPRNDDDEDVDLATLADEELEAEREARQETIDHIQQQLTDDTGLGYPRGQHWRIRARDAIRYRTNELREIQAEQSRRRNPGQMKRVIATVEHKQELHGCEQRFVAAARDLLGDAECARIWQHAEGMFPAAVRTTLRPET